MDTKTLLTTSLCSALAVGALAVAGTADAATIGPSDITYVSNSTTLTDAGTVVRGNTDQIEVRGRQNGQEADNRTVTTFANFDVSAFSATDIVTATLTLDYTSQLNGVNASPPAVVGRVLTAWDTSGTNNPLFTYGYDNIGNATAAADVAIIQADIDSTAPPVTDITVDLTAIVQGWIDGSFDNNGLAFFINGEASQGAGFNNAELEVNIVPEPGSLALLGLGGLLIARRRRNG